MGRMRFLRVMATKVPATAREDQPVRPMALVMRPMVVAALGGVGCLLGVVEWYRRLCATDQLVRVEPCCGRDRGLGW